MMTTGASTTAAQRIYILLLLLLLQSYAKCTSPQAYYPYHPWCLLLS